MTEDKVAEILLKSIDKAAQKVAEEIKSESVFSWQCVDHRPIKWQLGWYHLSHNKVYYPQATITRLSSGSWSIFVHIYGTPPLYGNEPSRELAMKKSQEFLLDNYQHL